MALVRWPRSVYLRYSFLVPLVVLALFAVVNATRSRPVKTIAYWAAIALLIVAAADLARSFIDQGKATTKAKDVPLTLSQFFLTALLGTVYTFALFAVMGLWSPLLIPPAFVMCCLAAWRNVRLGYRQGTDYEARLKEAEEIERLHRQRSQWREF